MHGFAFLSYATITVMVWINQRWRAGVGVLGLLLSVVPFATVPFDLAVDRRGLLHGGWRLAPGGEEPRGLIERAMAWVMRHPVLSGLLLVLFVAALFVTLLWLGPPVPKAG